MFERFTDRARRVVVLAQEEARELGHNYIGTEHLLLGLIHEGEGVAARALQKLDIDLAAVRRDVETLIGSAPDKPQGHIPFTPRGKKVIELSLREALQLGNNYIGTEHILLGLIREGEGVAAQILARLGADLPRARQQVIDILLVNPQERTRGMAPHHPPGPHPGPGPHPPPPRNPIDAQPQAAAGIGASCAAAGSAWAGEFTITTGLGAALNINGGTLAIVNLPGGATGNMHLTQIAGPPLPAVAVVSQAGFAVVTNVQPAGFTTYAYSYQKG